MAAFCAFFAAAAESTLATSSATVGSPNGELTQSLLDFSCFESGAYGAWVRKVAKEGLERNPSVANKPASLNWTHENDRKH